MREATRQAKLAAGTAITKQAAMELIAGAKSRSWSGCLSGDDWCGKIVFVNGKRCSAKEHQQNNAPTGYETRGLHRSAASAAELKRGDVVVVRQRQPYGRNRDGDTMYETLPDRKYVVV
jgi:hypothetical protein